ncbi:hypothetical protein CIB84_014631 [Bambusicola thoracicus]|uniref:Uncharacterized protein n=1 Tax=Bambusicola thoracicus TaxID=9083 RepID=A0A2P4SC16_BAMTH|nr:hypothetical protein CIB84_014631 [Bambusicola thoracicus]
MSSLSAKSTVMLNPTFSG